VNHVWTVRASLARDGSANVRTRAHGLTIGQSVDFGAKSPGASALETLLAALAADVLLQFRELCVRRRLSLDQAEICAQGRLGNELVTLGVIGESGDPALAEASLVLSITSPAAEEAIRRVWEEALARSPLVATLQKCVALNLTLEIL
jgi:hypothetical protein